MSRNFLFTSESVTEGHPDKIADQISDAVLDAIILEDRKARVACETVVKNALVMLAGEITANAGINYTEVAKKVIKEIGYDDDSKGLDYKTCAVAVVIERQSQDIKMGVDREDGEQGAGDQGMMFGYACSDTEELMPAPIMFAHRITRRLAEVRKSRKVDFLRPDGKAQVTVLYENYRPVKVTSVVVSTQHSPEVGIPEVREFVIEEVVKRVIPVEMIADNVVYHINPTGRFVIGGPHGDCGLTGRKIIVDTYGGMGRHGGGAFSGKDPSKVDRSASYMARYIAKNLVAAGVAERCEVQIAYAIGVPEPVSIMVDTFGTGKFPEEKIEEVVREVFPLKPRRIIEHLDLLRPIYRSTAAYGHFGRSEEAFTWEKTDMVERIKEKLF